MKTNLQISLSLLILAMITGCSVKFISSHNLFSISDVYYYSWMLGEDERATDIIIEISNPGESVEFKSITYRGIEVPVSITEKGKTLIVKGTINTGKSTIENLQFTVTGEPDKIDYMYKGSQHSYPLINIRREDTRYFKK